MGDKTGIQWTEATWNPVTGCDKVGPGCAHCYAETMANRLQKMGQRNYANGFAVTLQPHMLDLPRRWTRPRIIFVNSMSDLFHDSVPLDYIQQVFAVMAETPRHTYQVLTKRHERLARLAENHRFSMRADHLRTVPAKVRFLSVEPLLGPISNLDLTGIHWVIVGGESGDEARPMHPEWVRHLRDECGRNAVPFFFKQWGAWTPRWMGDTLGTQEVAGAGYTHMSRVGKHKAGRELDGRTWDEMPSRELVTP